MNCVVVAPDGSLEGHNHDAFGYVESIREAKPEWRADAGPIVVIGAGGGARAVLVGLIDRAPREIRLVNRTPARAQRLQRELGGPIRALPWDDRHAALDGRRDAGQHHQSGHGGRAAAWSWRSTPCRRARWFRISSTSRARRALLAAARKRGNPTVNGLGMLLHQARAAFRAWFGIMPEVTPELRAMIEATT